MTKLLLSILFVAFVSITGVAQNETSDTPSIHRYQLEFDHSDVSNIDDFKSFLKSICGTENIEFSDIKGIATIQTTHVLDPKIINGKLEKFGVDFYSLISN